MALNGKWCPLVANVDLQALSLSGHLILVLILVLIPELVLQRQRMSALLQKRINNPKLGSSQLQAAQRKTLQEPAVIKIHTGIGTFSDPSAQEVSQNVCSNNNGSTTSNMNCCQGRFCKRKLLVLAGVLVLAFFLAAAITLYILLRRPNNETWDLDPAYLPRILGRGVCTQIFTYQELKEATRKIEDDANFIDVVDGSVQTGILDDGTLVVIQKIQCETQHNFKLVLERIDTLSRISHRNIARIIGCCISSSYSLLLVHEFVANETVEELLQRSRSVGFSWYHRINIAMEIACALVYFESEISPPIYLRDIGSKDVWIDNDYTVKISSLKLLFSGLENESCSSPDSQVVYNFGIILLELILGSKPEYHPEIILHKINDRNFHEIVDPCLDFSEQLPVQCEQIERVACFAIQCLSSRMCMALVLKELVSIAKDSLRSSSGIAPGLEITFSNSSLLQMISMSPESIHVPPHSSFSKIP